MSGHDALLSAIGDDQVCPSLAAAGGGDLHELCNHLALELDALCGPVTDGNGSQLCGNHLIVPLLGLGFLLRRMTREEWDDTMVAYSVSFPDDEDDG
jgi:hypothetical protein